MCEKRGEREVHTPSERMQENRRYLKKGKSIQSLGELERQRGNKNMIAVLIMLSYQTQSSGQGCYRGR